jgi:CBS domain containing-hemolysin-like protein
LLYSLAGRVPCEGEEFEAGELRFVVDKVRRRRIERVLIVAEGIGRTAREIEE